MNSVSQLYIARLLPLCIAVLVLGILTSPAHAARLWSSGCEFQGDQADGVMATNGLEFTTPISSKAQIKNSLKRTGLSSCRVVASIGDSGDMTRSFTKELFTTATTDPLYIRFYFYAAAMPALPTAIGRLADGSALPARAVQSIWLQPDGTLELRELGGVTVISTYTAQPLVAGQWYRFEWYYDMTGSGVAEVRLNGMTIMSDTVFNGGGMKDFKWGLMEQSTTGDFYFDDIGINDTSGASQNSWLGPGAVVHLHPNAVSSSGSGAGNMCATGDWSSVSEITPDDAATTCTLVADADVLRAEIEPASVAGIQAADPISLMQVGVREATILTTAPTPESWKLFYRADTAQGPVYGVTTAHDDTTFRTNGDGIPRNYTLTSYSNPVTGAPWTATGVSSLDTVAIGFETVDADPDISLSTLWALIEFRKPQPTVTFTATPSTITQGGASSLTWSSTGATTCVASEGWGGVKALADSEPVTPTIDTTYTLTCYGLDGVTTVSVPVTVLPLGSPSSFTEPLGGPHTYRSNAGKYLHTGYEFQEKGASASGVQGLGLGADFITALSTLCLGIGNCVSDWWPTLSQPTSCKLEVKRVTGGSSTFGSVFKTGGCDARLSFQAKAAGWIATGMDYCDGGSCGGSSIAGCVYTRMVCTGGVTMYPSIAGPIYTHPATSAQTGDGYNFTFTPQCNDGINNDGSGGTDFPADPQCATYWDNDEAN